MRKTILAIWLAGVAVPAVARAQPDGGMPDGMAIAAPRAADEQGEQGKAGHTGYSDDPNGNMGNTGRTGKPAGGENEDNKGAEGSSGSAPDASTQHEPERR